MAAVTAIVAYSALAVAAAGTAASVYQSKQAADERKEAQATDTRLKQLQAQKQQMQQLRETQMRRSQILTAGAAQGATDSSGVQGGVGSAVTQGASNMAFSNQVNGIQTGISKRLQSAADYDTSAQMFSGIASIASSVAGNAGMFA